MIKLLSRLARPRAPRLDRRNIDPAMTFSPRDWADLPPHHPAAEAIGGR